MSIEGDFGIEHAHVMALLKADRRASCQVCLEPCGNCKDCRQYARAIEFVKRYKPTDLLDAARWRFIRSIATPVSMLDIFNPRGIRFVVHTPAYMPDRFREHVEASVDAERATGT